jgi:hypothetical protein
MKRPINSPDWEARRLADRESSHLWRSILKALGVMLFLLIVGVGLIGLKFMRKLSKIAERHKASFQQIDSQKTWAYTLATDVEDSLEKIDLRTATVSGLRGYDGIILPYASHRDTIRALLGLADSIGHSPMGCEPLNKTLLYHYGRCVIDIEPDGKAIMRRIDLLANPSLKLNAGQFILSRSMTLESFARRFPFSAEHRLPQGYYALRPLRRKPGEFLHLTFDPQGRLAYIHYYMGC